MHASGQLDPFRQDFQQGKKKPKHSSKRQKIPSLSFNIFKVKLQDLDLLDAKLYYCFHTWTFVQGNCDKY